MSAVTQILSGRIRVKRQTSSLLDSRLAVDAAPMNRQPQKTVQVEVAVVGGTVLNGRMTVYAPFTEPSDSYILHDRGTLQPLSISIENGMLKTDAAVGATQSDIIVEDSLTPGSFWKVFAEDGVLAIETFAGVTPSVLSLRDTVTAENYQLSVSDGLLGLDPDEVDSEVFLFTEPGVKRGIKQFTTIDGMTLSGIDGSMVEVRAINSLGQPVVQDVQVASSLPVRFYSQSGRIRMRPQGQVEPGNYKIMAEPDADIRTGDIVETISGVTGMTIGRVVRAEKIFDFAGATHHTEAEIADIN